MLNGLMDDHGKMYTPSIVRVGVNAHHSIKSVALDALVTHRLVCDASCFLSGTFRPAAGRAFLVFGGTLFVRVAG